MFVLVRFDCLVYLLYVYVSFVCAVVSLFPFLVLFLVFVLLLCYRRVLSVCMVSVVCGVHCV